jgi:hypothetical protein
MKHNLVLTFILIAPLIVAQEREENPVQSPYINQLGLQLNPYLDENLFQGLLAEIVFGIRYAYHLTPHLSAGPEVNGFAPIYFTSGGSSDFFRLGAGAFARYSFFTEKRIRVFAEVFPYYSYRYREESQWTPEIRENRFGICLSPGVTLFSKSRKFSLDLYLKFSNIDFVNSKNYVFSYKMNYHF